MATRFPMKENIGRRIQSYSWKSLKFNYFTSYGSCVNIMITEGGIILKTSFIFSILHNPIFIPWGSISDLTFKNGLIKRAIIKVGNNRLVVYGKVAKIVNDLFFSQK